MCIYVYVCIYVCVCMCIYMYMYVRVCVCVCMYVYVCVYIYKLYTNFAITPQTYFKSHFRISHGFRYQLLQCVCVVCLTHRGLFSGHSSKLINVV